MDDWVPCHIAFLEGLAKLAEGGQLWEPMRSIQSSRFDECVR